MTNGLPTIRDWLSLLADPAAVIDPAGACVDANEALVELIGRDPRGTPLASHLADPPADLADRMKSWARSKHPLPDFLQFQTPAGTTNVGVRAGRLSGIGDARPLILLQFQQEAPITEAFRTLTQQVDALRREISARKRAESELLALKASLEERVARRTAQLSELATRLIAAEESVRQRLAHVLHDDLQQVLVTAKIQADRIEARTDDVTLLRLNQTLRETLDEAITVSRNLTLDLSPPILHDAGLCAALEWLARRGAERYDQRVTVHADPAAEPEDEQIRIALFTAARELLFNVFKHARTDAAAIELAPAGDGILLRVRDEGTGFDPGSLQGQSAGEAFGLLSLRERTDLLGGQLHVDAAPGRGTTVEILLPRQRGHAQAAR